MEREKGKERAMCDNRRVAQCRTLPVGEEREGRKMVKVEEQVIANCFFSSEKKEKRGKRGKRKKREGLNNAGFSPGYRTAARVHPLPPIPQERGEKKRKGKGKREKGE